MGKAEPRVKMARENPNRDRDETKDDCQPEPSDWTKRVMLPKKSEHTRHRNCLDRVDPLLRRADVPRLIRVVDLYEPRQH